MKTSFSAELAAAAARLVVEEGMEYGHAKRKAARVLGRGQSRGADLPANHEVENEVRSYLQLYCADTQPAELAALRGLALRWMERLVEFRPHLTGAVWRGTATRLNGVRIELYCDDAKAAEIALINQHVHYDLRSVKGPRGNELQVLTLSARCPQLGEMVNVHLSVLDHDDLRGALKPDATGRTERGDLVALRRLMEPA